LHRSTTLQEGNTPLHLAAAGGHTRCVQLLMGSRNTDARSRQQQLQLRNAAGYTPLMMAAAAGHAQVVDAMLLAGADMHSSVLPVSAGMVRWKVSCCFLLNSATVANQLAVNAQVWCCLCCQYS
jgi:ankyrin repeat protein